MTTRLSRIIAVLMFVVALLAAGCSSATAPTAATGSGEQAKTATQQPAAPANNEHVNATMHITVYHATKDGMYLVPEVYAVPKNDHPAQTALELLLAAPKNPELVRVLPPDTKVKSITVKDHIAYVDFNERLIKNSTGGSATEMLTVGAIVNTLTEFPEVHKVQILVEGKKVETLSGHMDVYEPIGRMKNLIKTS